MDTKGTTREGDIAAGACTGGSKPSGPTCTATSTWRTTCSSKGCAQKSEHIFPAAP